MQVQNAYIFPVENIIRGTGYIIIQRKNIFQKKLTRYFFASTNNLALFTFFNDDVNKSCLSLLLGTFNDNSRFNFTEAFDDDSNLPGSFTHQLFGNNNYIKDDIVG